MRTVEIMIPFSKVQNTTLAFLSGNFIQYIQRSLLLLLLILKNCLHTFMLFLVSIFVFWYSFTNLSLRKRLQIGRFVEKVTCTTFYKWTWLGMLLIDSRNMFAVTKILEGFALEAHITHDSSVIVWWILIQWNVCFRLRDLEPHHLTSDFPKLPLSPNHKHLYLSDTTKCGRTAKII